MASEIAATVGRNIKTARLEKGFETQRALAAELKAVNPEMEPGNTRVSIWERGAEAPSQRYMESLCKVLDKSADWFYTDHDKPTETPDLIAEVTPPSDDEPAWVGRIEHKLDAILTTLVPSTEERSDLLEQVVVEAAEALRREQARGASGKRGRGHLGVVGEDDAG